MRSYIYVGVIIEEIQNSAKKLLYHAVDIFQEYRKQGF